MHKTKFREILFLALLGIAATTGCRLDLVKEPVSSGEITKNPADYADKILPPSNLTASQGDYRSIQLSWDKVDNAVQYIIYSAPTPFDTFEQIFQTAGTETTVTMDELSGVTKYFCVSAVNYYGTVSFKSKIVSGTSLSVPIITNIETDSEGNQISVSWWMDNCTKETYEDKVQYILTTYTDNRKLIEDKTITITDSSTTAIVDGLSPNTEYYFQVEALIKDSEQKSEKSDLTSAATAHKIIPDAPVDFEVSQGADCNYISLSWKLPAPVDYYDSVTSSFVRKPVKFKLYRRLLNANGTPATDFAQIAVISAENVSETDASIFYNCSTENVSNEEVLKVSKGDGNTADEYSSYIANSEITYFDYSAARKNNYEYYIQSFTDDTDKTITLDSSKSEIKTGWKINYQTFSSTVTYIYDEENPDKINSTRVNFNLDFEHKSKAYKYIITRQYTPLATILNPNPDSEAEEPIAELSSIGKVNSYVHIIDCTTSDLKEGYYHFKIYISSTENNATTGILNYLSCAEAFNSIVVVSNRNKFPKITWFSAEDGYLNKYILRWDYHEDYEYSIVATEYKNETAQTPVKKILSSEDYTVSPEGDTATYNFEAPTNSVYTFKLIGTPEDGAVEEKTLDQKFLTLGTVQVEIIDYDYDQISVKWSTVQMAKDKPSDFIVSAKYKTEPESGIELCTPENTKIEYNTLEETYYCTITRPQFFDNPTIAGRPIQLEITAQSATREDTSTGTSVVKLLGPALTNTTALEQQKSKLSIKWNEIEGTDKYIVYRVLYSSKIEEHDDEDSDDSSDENTELFSSIEAADKYFIDASDINHIVISESIEKQSTEQRAAVTYNAETKCFTLVDSQKDSEETSGYQINQAKIAWGAPYGYVVLPVKDEKDFNFESNSLLVQASTSKVRYGTLTPEKTATFGYGLNVKASKSTSANYVTVEWDKPFTTIKSPVIYRRNLCIDDSTWEKLDITLANDCVSWNVPVKSSEVTTDTQAYEYAVEYDGKPDATFVKSYTTELAATMEDRYSKVTYPGVEKETKNKGYVLAFADFDAKCNGKDALPSQYNNIYYEEEISWSPWDYSVRAVGPDSFTIGIMNYNLSSTKDWTLLGTGNNNNFVKATVEDTTLDYSSNSLKLRPTGLSNGTAQETNGVLKVLRDAKHYYSIIFSRADVSEADGNTRQAKDNSVYAYRQISDVELIKATMIYMNDGFVKIDQLDEANKSKGGEINGTVTIHQKDNNKTSKEFEFSFTNFAAELNTPLDKKVSLLSISSDFIATRDSTIIGGYIKTIPSATIIVKALDSYLPSSYSGTVTMALSSYKSATLSVNDTTISITDENTRRQWIPCLMNISFGNNESQWYHESEDYGWWN